MEKKKSKKTEKWCIQNDEDSFTENMSVAMVLEDKNLQQDSEVPRKRQRDEVREQRLLEDAEEKEFDKIMDSVYDKLDENIEVKKVEVLPPSTGYNEDDYINNHVMNKPKKGRKSKKDKMSNYNEAMSLLNKAVLPALQVLIDGLDDSNKYYRYKCAELLLKKSIPDKKAIIDSDGNGKKPPYAQVTEKDVDKAIMEVEALIHKKIKQNPLPELN